MDGRRRTSSSLTQKVSSVSGKSISAQTARRSLSHSGLHGCNVYGDDQVNIIPINARFLPGVTAVKALCTSEDGVKGFTIIAQTMIVRFFFVRYCRKHC